MALLPSEVDIQHVEASEYVTVIGVAILLWDHIITFADEVELVWSSRLSIPKVLFIFNRYIVPIVMSAQLHEFSGISPNISLPVWYAITVAVGMLSIATSNFLILLRLWVVWDRSPRLVLGTLAFFIVTQTVALSLAGYVIYQMLPTLVFNPLLRVCVPTARPNFVLLWTPGIAFELMIFLTTVWNALDRPRCHNAQMAKVMYRDGSLYFIGLFGLRIINMALSVAAPFSLSFLGVFLIWSISSITLSRLIFNLRRLSVNAEDQLDDEEGETDDPEKNVERLELTVLRSDFSRSSPGSPAKVIF